MTPEELKPCAEDFWRNPTKELTVQEMIDRSNTIANNDDNDLWFRVYAKNVARHLSKSATTERKRVDLDVMKRVYTVNGDECRHYNKAIDDMKQFDVFERE